MKHFAITLFLIVLSPLWSMAQQDSSVGRQHGSSELKILQIQEAPVLDGRLDEGVWQDVAVAGEFAQRDPDEGMPATEKTEVRALYDKDNLYFGVRCFDSRPGGILATELRRDNDFGNDDSFAIILDTFHDHRNAFLFKINPKGTQYDALVTDEGRDLNDDWDEKWEVETQVDEEGWSAEIKIPLRTIRFASSSTSFGVDFERVIRRKNEFSYWNNYDRDFSFQQLSQAGHLVGLVEVEAALRLRVKPYINTRVVTQGAGERNTSLLGDVGLEDLKYSVTSGLTLDLTVNTDFAETEVDNQVINFDRFPVFFPEKREFFLEGAGIFGVNALRFGRAPDIKIFHSRQIGLSESGEAIPILAGAKLTGKFGDKFTLGVLNAQTDDFQGRPGDNFGVVRLKRDLFSRSSLGFYLTSRQAEGGDFNRVVGVDQNLVFFQHLKVVGMLAKTFAAGVDDRQWMGAIKTTWQDDFLTAAFTHFVVEENFDPQLGFLKRENVRNYGYRITLSPRPDNDRIRQFNSGVHFEHFRGADDNELVTEVYHLDNSIQFQDGSSIAANPHHKIEVIEDEPLRLPGGLQVPPGRYSWWYSEFRYRLNPARKLTGTLGYRTEWNYYGPGGQRQQWDIGPSVSFSSRFSLGINYSINRIKISGEEAPLLHQVNNRFNFALSRKWLTSALVQYNSSGDLWGVNFRLNYIYRPGDDLFIVFNEFREDSGPVTDIDRSFIVKFTHSFDF